MTERASAWGLRALALAAAIVVWFSASIEKRERLSEKLIDAAVTYNPPRGFIVLDPVQSVKVRLRGPDRQIRNLAPYAVDVLVDLGGAVAGTLDVHLEAQNVLRPGQVEVVSIEPSSLRLRLDDEVNRELPVLPRIVGEPAGGAVPLAPTVRPDRVTLRGPKTLLDNLSAVTTSPISLDGHALDFSQIVTVVSPDALIRVVEPSAVTVSVRMQPPSGGEDEEAGEGSEASPRDAARGRERGAPRSASRR
jgi:YbbR domain-containing protein